MNIIRPNGVNVGANVNPAGVGIAHHLSLTHIRNSAFFAKSASLIENNPNGRSSEGLRQQHMSYVMGAILSAVSFLEANINEFFWEVSETTSDRVKELDVGLKELLTGFWKQNSILSRYSILEKYQLVLVLARKPIMDKGKEPYQPVDDLIQLRNTMVHYKPEWVFGKPLSLEERLRGKFELNPLAPQGSIFFPYRCLSFGCSKWAIESSLQFTDEFYKRIGVAPGYEHIRQELQL